MNDLQPTHSIPERLRRFAASLEQRPPVHCPVENLFAPGVYIRKCTLPAGTDVMGAAHKTAHFCIVLKGRIQVVTANGGQEFVAGDIFVSQPGDQRGATVIEETVWLTVHPNPDDEQDLAVIVPRLVHATLAQLQGGEENQQALNHSKQEKLT